MKRMHVLINSMYNVVDCHFVPVAALNNLNSSVLVLVPQNPSSGVHVRGGGGHAIISEVLTILTCSLESTAESYLGKDQFGFRKGHDTRDAIAAVHVLYKGNLQYNNEVCLLR